MFFGWGKKKLDAAKEYISPEIQKHLPTLSRRRMSLIKIDAYGIVDAKRWHKEVRYFFDNVIKPKLTWEHRNALEKYGIAKILEEMIENPAREEAERLLSSFSYDHTMSPIEYERFCATRLESTGWMCEMTSASGDQGADIIARKSAYILVVQCKRYSANVGNWAVQEAIAARSHFKASHACVVSNASFTRSAQDLADSTGVFLVHHNELDIIESRFG